MKTITIKKGLDLPLAGAPVQEIRSANQVSHVGLVGDDYIGMKPTMLVQEGDSVKLGQPVFEDKKNPGVIFTSPGSGVVTAVNRGAKRKFESLVIELKGDDEVSFTDEVAGELARKTPTEIRNLLVNSGLWTSLRTRPFGRIPAIDGSPSSLFITAIDTCPLGVDPAVVLQEKLDGFTHGVKVLEQMLEVPIHICTTPENKLLLDVETGNVHLWGFAGPHPAGLPSTHIHHIDPVHLGKQVWHVGYQDVIRIGQLFLTGKLQMDTVVALGGEGVVAPALVATRVGASIDELCAAELKDSEQTYRVLSGDVLDGRPMADRTRFMGRYHTQVATLADESGRSFFGWLHPGGDRLSVTGLFLSAFKGVGTKFSLNTAVWGGRRAIFPLDVYSRVMPLDIMPLHLLKSLAVGDTEKASELGCLELVEEDLALCTFVCPGKNEFGPMLRDVLTTLEQEC